MPYATLAELKDWVGITPADLADDAKLTLALDSASALVDAYTGRYFTADGAAVARDYVAVDSRYLDVGDISSTVGLVISTDEDDNGVYETVWATTDYRLEPPNAATSVRPWTRIVAVGPRTFPTSAARRWPAVRVAARGGWPAPPAAVKTATLIQAAFLWARKDARFGVAGSPELGNEMRVESALDRTAQALLRPFRRNWVVMV